MKKIAVLLFIVAVFLEMCGCETMKRKFVRKPKESKKPVPVLHPVNYQEDRDEKLAYKRHFTFWQMWQQTLIDSLGENYKKSIRCIDEASYNLAAMRKIVSEAKKTKLQQHLKLLNEIKHEIVNKKRLSEYDIVRLQRRLKKQKKTIEKDFSYSKLHFL
jgi:hypothetical protein